MAVNRKLLGELLKIFDVIKALQIIDDAIEQAKAYTDPGKNINENHQLWEVIGNYASIFETGTTKNQSTTSRSYEKALEVFHKLKSFISRSVDTYNFVNGLPYNDSTIESNIADLNKNNIFKKINDHNKDPSILSYDEQYKLLQEVYKIVGEDLFWNNVKKTIQKLELKDKRIGSIFCYYHPDIEPSYCSTSPIIIADENNYILESKGDSSTVGKIQFYIFDEETFGLKKIEDSTIKTKLIEYKNKKFYHFNEILNHTNFCIYDISLLHTKISTVLNNLLKITSYYGTDYEILNMQPKSEELYSPVTEDCIYLHNFIKEICSVRLENNNMSVTFTDKNLVIHTFLFANRIDMLLNLLETTLSPPNLDRLKKIVRPQYTVPKTVGKAEKYQSKILFGTNKANLDVKEYIFNKLLESNNIMMFIKTYNYLSMTDFNNDSNYEILPDSSVDTFINFCHGIDEFLTKCSTMSSFLKKMNFSKPNDIVTSFVLSYIFDILREKNNIPFNKTRIIDNMTNYKRAMDETLIEQITPIKQHIYNWLNKSSTDPMSVDNYLLTKITPIYKDIEPEYNKIFNKNVDIFTKISFNNSYENLDVNKLVMVLIDNPSTDKVSLDNNSLTYKLFMFMDMNERDIVEKFIVACSDINSKFLMIFIEFIFRMYEDSNFHKINFKNFRSTICHIIENVIDEKKYEPLHDFIEIINIHSKNMINIANQKSLKDSLKILTHLNMIVNFLIKISETSKDHPDHRNVNVLLKQTYVEIRNVMQKK